MPQGMQGTGTFNTQTRVIRRIVGEKGLMLEPELAVLITFLSQLKKKTAIDANKIERFADDLKTRWGQFTADSLAASGTITVGTTAIQMMIPGDVILVPKAVSSSVAPELIRILTTNQGAGTATVTRGFAGTTAADITALDSFAYVGQAFAQGFSLPTSRYTTPTVVNTYQQIFSSTVAITQSAAALPLYASGSGERKRLHAKMLNEIKVDMARAFLWGTASIGTDPTSGETLSTSMGFNSAISSNITNGGGAVTLTVFEAFARQMGRYNSNGELLLLAPPMLISAINSWGNSKLQLHPTEKMFGVNVNRLQTGHCDFILVRDVMLEDGISGKNGFGGTAFAINPNNVEMFYLKGNDVDRDVQLNENVLLDGADRRVDQALFEGCIMVAHEKTHGKMYNITSFA